MAKSNKQLQEENQRLRRELRAANARRTLDAVSRLVGEISRLAAKIAWPIAAAVVGIKWAGKLTIADVKLAADVGINLDRIVALAGLGLGIAGVIYGKRERQLRLQLTEDLGPYKRAAQESIDPRRTSSQLTRSGETNPEDR